MNRYKINFNKIYIKENEKLKKEWTKISDESERLAAKWAADAIFNNFTDEEQLAAEWVALPKI